MTGTVRGAARRIRGAADTSGHRPSGDEPAPAVTDSDDERRRKLRPVRDAMKAAACPSGPPARPEVCVAVAASYRLVRALAWEWDQVVLEASSDGGNAVSGVDFVLIEVRAGRVPGWGPVDGDPLTLAASARETGVPVAVWVTAGSSDTETAAALMVSASVVFVADAQAVSAWRRRWPENRIHELAPATAPRLHSPVRGGRGVDRVGAVALVADEPSVDDAARAGMDSVIIPATKMSSLPELHLWRPKKEPDADVKAPSLPPGVRNAVVTGVVHDVGEPLVDQYRVVVDAARSAPDSTWTLLDAGAAQSCVVALPEYHNRLPEHLSAHVATADGSVPFGREIVARATQPELRDREALRLQRAVLAEHTIGHRADTMLATMGHAVTPADQSVSVIVPTNRAHEIDNVLANVARQAHRDIELVLVLHGLATDERELATRANDHGIDRLRVIHADSSLPLGTVMNMGLDAASGRYLAKMDDDNFYGRHYLTDLLGAFAGTDAGVVGKWSHYVWLRSTDAVVLRYADHQNRYHRLVQGGSIVADSELAKEFRFSDIPRAIDSDFLNRLWAAGVKTYSADRYNFVSIRSADNEAHTWKVTDAQMMVGGAEVVFYGDPRSHVQV